MLASLLITFREGLEAALIVGIVLGYLSRLAHAASSSSRGSLVRQRRSVWWGVAAAVAVSIIAAAGLQAVGARFEGRSEEVFEGIMMLLAAGMLTWMIFWMQSQGSRIRGQLERDVQQALGRNRPSALFGLAFLAVVREGIETALFLSASLYSSSAQEVLLGGTLGLAAAVLVGWLVFAASVRLNVSRFFQVTGILLLLVSAGLVAHGVHELQEAALVPTIVEHVWDINLVLDENSTAGMILQSLFGYNGNPSLLEVLSYSAYGAAVLAALAWRGRRTSHERSAPADWRRGGARRPSEGDA